MEKKMYVIYWDSQDDCCHIKGYIYGTQDEADAYCNELNKNNKYYWEDYTWEELKREENNRLNDNSWYINYINGTEKLGRYQ